MSDSKTMGFLNVNKPPGWTSHDVVAQVRRRYKTLTGSKKVGHAGTLDPLATGVLILCLGGATRLSDYMMHTTKQYRAQVTFGKTTTTYDAEGDIVTDIDAGHITRSDIEAILPRFIGDIQQVPPMYSAIKVDGQKLYDLARDGKTIKRDPRAVTIHEINIVSWESPTVELDVVCSSGTYIRSLAFDLGEILGVGAYLSDLIRVRNGQFHLDSSLKVQDIMEQDDWYSHLISPYDALKDRPMLIVDEDEIQQIQHGQFIPRLTESDEDTVFAFRDNGDFVAILTSREKFWKPHKVFLHQT